MGSGRVFLSGPPSPKPAPPPLVKSTVEAPASNRPSSPPSPADSSGTGQHASSLGSAWFLVPPSWDIHQEEGQWRACFLPPSALGTQELCLVPNVEVHCLEDPVCGACFFFLPHVQFNAAPCFSQPSEVEMARDFSCLAPICSFLLPPIGSDP